MRVVLQKYGGSSVADLEKIRAVADRIAQTVADGTRLVAVVSAMGNTTNELITLAREISGDPHRRELDMLISVGERVTMALLAMALHERGVPARSLTGSQSGIITDEAHADARVVEVRPARLLETVADGTVAIVAGFQGVSRDREVTTLGRGGSDTTAVVLAAALGAAHCEICSDVDGVWSADPRVVPSAHKLEELSLDEALVLARGGAKVLFEDAVRYARDHGVELIASATFGPGSGTRLRTARPAARAGAVAVTSDRQLARGAVDPSDPDVVGAALALGLRLRQIDGRDALWDLRNAHGRLPDGLDAVARVTAVGTGLGERPAEVVPGWAALRAAGVAVRRSGASGDAAWWETAPDDLDAAVRAVHDALTTS
jgi:aspartate kinase